MNYKFNWSQEYVGWVSSSEKLLEIKVETSGYKEAKELIEKIKKIL